MEPNEIKSVQCKPKDIVAKRTYTTRNGTVAIIGHLYEALLAMLFLIEGKIRNQCKKIDNFFLATNMEDAGDFDDIVFESVSTNEEGVAMSKTVFLQAKRKANVTITLDKLLSESDKKEDFSLKDYFSSYRKIKRHFCECKIKNHPCECSFKNSEFVIYTCAGGDASFDSKILDDLSGSSACTKNLVKYDVPKEDILNVTDKSNFYFKLQLGGDREIDEKIFNVLSSFSDCKKLVKLLVISIFPGKQGAAKIENNKFIGHYHVALANEVLEKKQGNKGVFTNIFINDIERVTQRENNFRYEFFAQVRKLSKFSNKSDNEVKKELGKVEIKLYDEFGKANEKVEQKPLPADLITRDEVVEFLNKLKIYVKQPNESELGEILREKVKTVFSLEENEADLFFLDIQERLIQYNINSEQSYNKKKRNYITENSEILEKTKDKVLKTRLRGLALLVNEKFEKLQLYFKHDQIKELQNLICRNQVCTIITNNESTLLSTAKVHQAFKDMPQLTKDEFIFMNLRSVLGLHDEVVADFKNEKTKFLVIECDLNTNIEKLYEDLSSIVESKNEKKLVLIGQQDNALLEKFKTGNYREIEENLLGLNDLTEESQSTLLKNKEVTFQGKSVSLKTIIDEEAKYDLIDAGVLSKLIINEKVEIGKELKGYSEIKEIYIDRIFSRYVKIKNDFLNEKYPKDIFVLSNINRIELPDALFDESNSNRCIRLEDESLQQRDYKNHNIHWLRKEENNFIWQRTHGDLTNLRKLVDESSGNEYREDKITAISDKLMILSAEAGMGKSTIMTKLAEQSKLSDPSLWVIRINLNDHTKKLRIVNFDNNKEKAIEFLQDIEDLKDNLELALFKSRFNEHGKIVIYFDGFDEIGPYYEDKVMELLTLIKVTKVSKLWITTRLHAKNKLEDRFSTLSYALKPLSEENQKLFLKKFWGQEKSLKLNVENERLNNYVNELLAVWKISIHDSDVKFTGIPLQTRMLAEIFQEPFKVYYGSKKTETNLPKKLNLVDLYEMFIEKKFEIYCEEKKQEDVTKVSVIRDNTRIFRYFKELHELLALNTLFSEEDIDVILSEEDKKTLREEKIGEEITGIVNEIIDDKPSFIHRTFAEFFAANWFAKKQENQKIKELLEKNLFKIENEVFRNFLDRILAKSHELNNAVLNNDEIKIRELLSNADINQPDNGGRTALHIAASSGYEHLIDDFVKIGAQVNEPDSILKWTPLRYADRGSYWSTAELLLQNNANSKDIVEVIKRSDEEKDCNRINSFLHLAAEKGYLSLLKALETETSNLTTKYINISNGIFEDTPLLVALQFRQIEVARYFIEKDAKLDVANLNGESPLLLTIRIGSLDILKLLTEKGADLMMDDNDGESALHIAAGIGSLKFITYLLEIKPALIKVLDDEDQTPLYFAARNGNKTSFDLLVENGADLKVANKYGRTVFHVVIQKGHLELFMHLLRNKDFIFSADKEGNTSLHIAIENDRRDMLQLLVDIEDAPLNHANKKGETPLYSAVKCGRRDILELLIEKGADLNKSDNRKLTPLHLAVVKSEKEMLEMLVENKANLNQTNRNGETPLHIAAKYNKGDIFDLLINNGSDSNISDNKGKTPLQTRDKSKKTK